MKTLLILFVIILILYFLLTAPRMFHRADCKPLMSRRFYAHRGLFDNEGAAPENSLAAFKKAVDAGYGIELDIQLSKDDQVVVFHDAALKRMCGVEGHVWDYTLEELQKLKLKDSNETIPTFAEVLKLVGGKAPLIVEYKMDRPLTKICVLGDKLLRKYEGVYCIESFHPLALMWYRKHRPEVVRGQLSGKLWREGERFLLNLAYLLVSELLTNVAARPDFIAYDHTYAGNLSRRICRRLGALSVTYTIKNQEQYEKVKNEFDLFIFDSCILKE